MSSAVVRERPGTPHRANIAAAFGIIVLAGLGAWAYIASHPQTEVVVRGDIVGRIPFTGSIIVPPSAQAIVFSPYRAPIEKVDKSIGSRVGKGEIVVELAMPSVEASLDQARENLKRAVTAYADTRSQYDRIVADARKQLDAALAQTRTRAAAPSVDSTVSPPPSPVSTEPARLPSIDAAQRALAQAVTARDAALAPYLQQLEAARSLRRGKRGNEGGEDPFAHRRYYP